MLRDIDLGDVIAERELRFEVPGASPREVVVKVGKPVRDPTANHETWICPFLILGLGREKPMGIFGADALQALLLSLHTIPVELAAYAREVGGRFLQYGEPAAGFVGPCKTALEYAADVFPEPDPA
jgi:hypothetical protein